VLQAVLKLILKRVSELMSEWLRVPLPYGFHADAVITRLSHPSPRLTGQRRARKNADGGVSANTAPTK